MFAVDAYFYGWFLRVDSVVQLIGYTNQLFHIIRDDKRLLYKRGGFL